ncbi:Kazal-type Proteinase Inhibitor 2 [Hibiscus trionum]|uniref:Kazal-type Proteinase Inhibitor 2 n=1 Tax=Hibiscus trionum TaxID=183268 RepID=A0A9W7JFY4_HIBTR|nr:Kazal-type Proteinase Inhibitor 2 [Hibiscus trionum]
MVVVFSIQFHESALSILLLLMLLVVPFSSSSSSSFTVGSGRNFTAGILLPSDAADACGVSLPSRRYSCPVSCFRTDPVCGDDGVTYWCGCADAHCSGAKVAKIGFCNVGNNGGTGSFPGQALLLLHIVWLIVLGFSVFFGLI